MELLTLAAIVGVLFGVAPRLLLHGIAFFRLSIARAEIQRDARVSMDLMLRQLRQGLADSVVVDQASFTEPPYSRLRFDVPGNGGPPTSYVFWQEGRELRMSVNASTRSLSGNLRTLTLTYPDVSDPTLLSISLTMEKSVSLAKRKTLQMSVEKVRILN